MLKICGLKTVPSPSTISLITAEVLIKLAPDWSVGDNPVKKSPVLASVKLFELYVDHPTAPSYSEFIASFKVDIKPTVGVSQNISNRESCGSVSYIAKYFDYYRSKHLVNLKHHSY